jgi:hypothetical protein
MKHVAFALSLTFLVSLAACGKKPAVKDAAAPAESAKPSEAAEPATEPKAAAEPVEAPPKELKGCDKTLHDFDEALTAASHECKKDADCGCFPPQLSKVPGNDCGGIVDKKALKKLDALVKDAKKNGCGTMAQCEPWTCEPICEEGRCQRGPRAKK